MKHPVTVSTYRAQVFNRINEILLAGIGNRPQVVDFDIGGANGPVGRLEIKATDSTIIAVVLDARLAGLRTTVIGLGRGRPAFPLGVEFDLGWRLRGKAKSHAALKL